MQFQGSELTLTCWPEVPEHVARPWDAADELLLECGAKQMLIINDRYGALQTAFPHAHVWADSRAAMESAHRNLAANHKHAEGLVMLIEDDLTNSFNHAGISVLIKVPKQFELLQFWLSECQKHLPSSTRYYLAGMVKHWPVNWLNWLQQHAATYTQSQIQRKARRVEITLSTPIPAPKRLLGYSHKNVRFDAFPGVFARDSMDIGSQVLLAQQGLNISGTVCDLGCGNGLLGLTLFNQHPIKKLILTDDSYLAVRSAQQNATLANIPADVRHGDCLEAVTENLDWVICNPPFHDGHKQLTNIATTMFRESADKLNADGNLLVIANRHLPYTPVLSRYFKHVNSLGKDPRFSLYHCIGPIHKNR